MVKEHQVLRFIAERVKSSNVGPFPRLFYPRVQSKIPVSYDDVAGMIRDDRGVMDYVVDTNVFTAHEMPTSVWEAFAARRLILTRGVWQELGPWRTNPFCNQKVVGVLEGARSGRTDGFVFDDLSPLPPLYQVFHGYYVNVLAERKRKAVELVKGFVKRHSRDPSDEEMRRLFQVGFNERDAIIFAKGFKEISVGRLLFTDEEIVAHSATVAFGAGVNVTVLTRDHDVFEQFYKLTGLLTQAYQGTLFAQRYAADTAAFRTAEMPSTPETNACFVVPGSFLVQKPVPPDEFMSWLMPPEWVPVRFCCVLLAGRPPALTMTAMSFIGEKGMLSLVEAKGRTWGLNTDRLGGKNCHVTGFPKTIPNAREYVIVSEDQVVLSPSDPYRFSKLELAHSVFHFEEVTTG